MKISIFWTVFQSLKKSIWEGPGASKLHFPRRRRTRKTPHYMVRGTLLHLPLLVRPSGQMPTFNKIYDPAIKNRILLNQSVQNIQQWIWASSIMLYWLVWNWIWSNFGNPDIRTGNKILTQKWWKSQFSEKCFRALKSQSGKVPAHQNCNFAAAGAKEKSIPLSFTWCEALSSIFPLWPALRADLDPLNFGGTSASNLEILWHFLHR